MADTLYLKQRRQTWFTNIPVPRDLQEQLGKDHIVQSLKTRDLSVAQRRRWSHVEEAHATFDRHRGSQGTTPEEIEDRAWKAYEQALREAEEGGLDEEGINLYIGLLGDQIDDGKLDEAEEAEAWAKITAMHGRRAALRGQPFQPPPTFGPRGIDRVTLRPVSRKKTAGDPLPFSEAAQRYLEETQRDPDAALTQQTVGQSEAVFRLFKDFCRDAPLVDITRAEAGEFLSTVATLDRHWGRSPKTKERSLEDLLELYGGHPTGLSNKTLNRYASVLGVVFKWARKRGLHDGENPFEGQSRKGAKTRKTGWLPFTMAELSTLLSSLRPQVAPNAHTVDTALAWAVWIGAYSGMRLNEICSLDVADVRKEKGVWFFDVADAKTEAGVRRVPVHSVLLEADLLDYRKRVGSGSLWPGLKPGGPDRKLSWYTTKRFTRVRRGLGLTRDRLAFHSLRNNVGGALEAARVPESEAVQILGHEKLSMSYAVYSLGLELPALKEVVEKIDYPTDA